MKNSNHVLFREYSYIRATLHNRASFIRVFWRCYRQIGKSGGESPNTDWTVMGWTLCKSAVISYKDLPDVVNVSVHA